MDLSEIGRQFGLNEEQTRAAVEALTPVVAAGMRRNGGAGGGLNDIISSITQGGAPDEPDAATSQGNDILGQIFGSKEVSRGVANELSATLGHRRFHPQEDAADHCLDRHGPGGQADGIARRLLGRRPRRYSG